MIYFNGQNSDDYRVIVEHYPARPVPKRKVQKWSVPGLSGDVLQEQDAWENVQRRYDVYFSAEEPKLPPVVQRAVEWLSAEGWCELSDEYDLATYTLARLEGGLDIENILNDFGRVTLVFD